MMNKIDIWILIYVWDLIFWSLCLQKGSLIKFCQQKEDCNKKWIWELNISIQDMEKILIINNQSPGVNLVIGKMWSRIEYKIINNLEIQYEYRKRDVQEYGCSIKGVCCQKQGYFYEQSQTRASMLQLGEAQIYSKIQIKQIINGQLMQYWIQNGNFIKKQNYSIQIISSLSQQNTNILNISSLYPQLRLNYITNITSTNSTQIILIPKKYYYPYFKCRTLTKLTKNICPSNCSIITITDFINNNNHYISEADRNLIPPDFIIYDQTIIKQIILNFTVNIVIYDPITSPQIMYTSQKYQSNILIVQNQIIKDTILDSLFCLNLAFVNPSSYINVAFLKVFSTNQTIYSNIFLFSQYQYQTLKICTNQLKYILNLNGFNYTYSYDPIINHTVSGVPKTEELLQINEIQNCGDYFECRYWLKVIIGGVCGAVILIIVGILRRVYIYLGRQKNKDVQVIQLKEGINEQNERQTNASD